MNKSRIIQGLMRVDRLSDDELYELIKFDIDNGIYFFDIADCYVNTEAESKLGRILTKHPELREKMYIQTKCTIVRGESGVYYDSSFQYILDAVNASLKRMNLEYIDSILLHRPDIFLDADEVNKAINILKSEGKIRHFGVSNYSKEMIEYLSSTLDEKISYNQIQLGLGQTRLLEESFNFNIDNKEGRSTTVDTYFFLKRKGIIIQAWSPFIYGFFEGSLFDEEKYPRINNALKMLADKYHTSKCAIATAFILMLNKDITVITGSMNIEHVKECLDGENIALTKEEWYYLYKEAGNTLP